jgi:hypothetical protein
MGELDRKGREILDFGAGHGVMKTMLEGTGAHVTNFDIEPDLTEVENWQDVSFDIMVANEVFYAFEPQQLMDLLDEVKIHNPRAEIILGVSKQSFLNNVGKILLGKPGAHKGTKIGPKREIAIFKESMEVLEHQSVWFLADVYRLRFKQ